MAYESIQAILEEAGMSHQQLGETPYGAADGTNKLFTTNHKPLSDTNYDGIVDKDDILVLVNGVPTTVEAVDAQKGVITLVSAPSLGAEIVIDYRYSAVNMTFVERLRAEAMDWINRKAKKVDPSAPYNEETNNPTVNAICRLYCAGMLLTRDYGFNQDTEMTSKDGYYRLGLVTGSKTKKGMLQEFLDDGGITGVDSDSARFDDIASGSDGDLFGGFDNSICPNPDRDW